MKFSVGSLVRARGREWVVLPDSGLSPHLLMLRPLGGSDEEVTGVYIGPGADGKPLEEVTEAQFPPPDPNRDLGSHLSSSLLRDAVRFGFRSPAGPFRSLGRIAIEPRPYQLVPLLMALRQDPVRLLIADEQGIGKTVEALLIARELLDRGEIERMTVLCPPHLAEQWQRALSEQFYLDAELVLSGTAARLERSLLGGELLFQRFPITVVSTDYIKQQKRRELFLHSCPELVIVDEAHNCADSGGERSATQQRHTLLQDIAKDPNRHLILVTAAPHSGSPQAFRSLLGLLNPELRNLPEDLTGDENRKHREHLARHLVQRQRGDIEAYLDSNTPFPVRKTGEDYYSLDPKYRSVLNRVVDFCRESVLDEKLEKRRQRIRWWSALALLRSLSSSPEAAVTTLTNRAGVDQIDDPNLLEEEGRRAILDLDDENQESIDVVPGSQEDEQDSAHRRRLLDFAKEIKELSGKHDQKLKRIEEIVKNLLSEGFAPVIFCRFIPTAGYVAEHLRKKLKDANVESVDGTLHPDERERRVRELAQRPKRVLVCTDCLSEGINLQEGFDSVIHYDLAWNPTRHEQREGRVDRFGQPKAEVRTLTYSGKDNPIDGIVWQVLLRKQKTIQKQLGGAVPIPADTEMIEKAIYEGLLLRKNQQVEQFAFSFSPQLSALDVAWDKAVEREKKSRALFAQHPLQKAIQEQLTTELSEVTRVLGGEADIERFTKTSLRALKATLKEGPALAVDVKECPAALKDAVNIRESKEEQFTLSFQGRPPSGAMVIRRAHPLLAGLAQFVLESALDPQMEGPARRCAVVRTKQVNKRTTLLLVRIRLHLISLEASKEKDPKKQETKEKHLLAEDQMLVAFTGTSESPQYLSQQETEKLLSIEPSANISSELAKTQLSTMFEKLPELSKELSRFANERGEALLAAHQRVRQLAKGKEKTTRFKVHEPLDVIGGFIYLPDVAL